MYKVEWYVNEMYLKNGTGFIRITDVDGASAGIIYLWNRVQYFVNLTSGLSVHTG